MIRTSLIAAGLAASLAPAVAAGPAAPAPAQMPDISGFYFGLNAAYAQNVSDFAIAGTTPANLAEITAFNRPASGDFGTDGFVGGAHAGLNWNFGAAFIGIEGDYAWADIQDSVGYTGAGGQQNALSLEIDWLATARLRLGTVLPVQIDGIRSVTGYVTGGWAWAGIEQRIGFATALGVGEFAGGYDDTADGWTLGGGVELDYGGLRSRLEYLYTDLDDRGVALGAIAPATGGFTANWQNELHLVRIGLSVPFGGQMWQ